MWLFGELKGCRPKSVVAIALALMNCLEERASRCPLKPRP